ncbi:MAG TPA: metallophosphoesterase [Spirochaetia bacterium]|nr:metallophosphoesterase [Spirochaetia bacterium]
MKQLTILHLADIHFAPDKKAEALASLETAYETGKRENVDLWAIAGDLFERAIYNTENSGLPELQRMLQRMMDLAPIVAVRGTKTHDADGCYEVLQETSAKHRFTLLDPRYAYFLIDGKLSCHNPTVALPEDADLLILGCPEPSKEWFMAEKRMGGEEASEAIKDGMRDMLLGFAAIRKQYPQIPSLFIGHLTIAGANLANDQILPGGGIQIGRDDLALVGADYYALGHIHLAQQIGDLPAYYAGSAYPVDWGETDQKRFNLIRFDEYTEVGFPPVIEPHDFPHPPRKKIKAPYTNESTALYGSEDCIGFQVWLQIQVQQGCKIDTEAYLQGMMADGALPGSRVTVEIVPAETVRAGEIQAAKSLREKVQIYAHNSGQQIPGKALDKADTLEMEARREGGGADGLHIRIDKLSLRGAIGTWKGLGKDQVELDLAEYDPGLVALLGPNGAGKTTLIENMHPFPDLLTRAGKLQDHFRLRDSHRDLCFTDERTGEQYRAFIQIDGQNKTGKAEYHLYKNGQPLTNGRKEDYESKVLELFGSLSLFQRSAFIAQKPSKNNPDLSEATKGEKKALFRELGGLDYLQAHSETSKDNAKTLDERVIQTRGRTETLQELIAKLPELEGQKRHDENNLAQAKEALKLIDETVEEWKTTVEEVEARVDKNRETQGKITDINEQIHQLRRDAHSLETEIEDYQVALGQKDETEKALQEYESLKAEESKLNEEKAGILEERERLLSEYRNAQDIAEAERRKVEAKKTEISHEMADFQQKKAVFLTQIDNLQKRLEEKVECPKCGNRFSLGQEVDEKHLKENQSQVWEADQKLTALEKQIVAFDKRIADIQIPEEPKLPEWDDTRIDEIQFGLGNYNLAGLQRTRDQANEAGVRIEENGKQLQKNAQQQHALSGQLTELNKQLDPECEREYEDAGAELEAAEKVYIDGREEVRGIEVALEKLGEAIEDLKAKKKELADLRQSIRDQEVEIAEWRYLERACGPDGIQALELDAMGPSVAEVANEMLEAAYGARFRVEFRTTRIGGSGSKTKQIEDFQIWILDSQSGDEQLLETLSGGESVWIKRAIYDAFGIIRDRNTGQRFLTAFQDEADGALDPEARLAYFRMLERAHEISGRQHTIIISHSEAAREMIAQKIEMVKL